MLCAVAIMASLLLGHGSLDAGGLGRTFLRLRAARALVGFWAGASLAVGGVVVQGLFRNPLASPSILGTTAGASLGGQLSMLLGTWLGALTSGWVRPELVLPLGCVTGALLALLLLLAVHRVQRQLLALLLTGFVMSSLFLSIGAFVISLAQESWELGRAIVVFSLGHLGGAGSLQVLMVMPLAVIGIAFAWYWGRPLDLMLSGEEEAQSLGLHVDGVRRWCIIWTALLTAGAVAVGGNIAFVGLVVPHALRPFVGHTHRALIPAAALGGGAFVMGCDVVARTLPAHGEIPLGVVTGLVGAPAFLLLLLRTSRESQRD
jgi:iron complex transport system permease protein